MTLQTDNAAEKGQAIVEMTMSLVAIMAVFLGVIFAFAIGDANIRTLLECRGNADSYAGNGVFGDAGMPIQTWTSGHDARMYTNDDTPVIGTNDDPDLFRGELQANGIDLVNGFDKSYVKHDFAADIANSSSLFLDIANLTSYSKSVDPMEEVDMDGLDHAFKALIYNSDITVDNSAFMPIFQNENEAP